MFELRAVAAQVGELIRECASCEEDRNIKAIKHARKNEPNKARVRKRNLYVLAQELIYFSVCTIKTGTYVECPLSDTQFFSSKHFFILPLRR